MTRIANPKQRLIRALHVDDTRGGLQRQITRLVKAAVTVVRMDRAPLTVDDYAKELEAYFEPYPIAMQVRNLGWLLSLVHTSTALNIRLVYRYDPTTDELLFRAEELRVGGVWDRPFVKV